jgi:hypothetical protein
MLLAKLFPSCFSLRGSCIHEWFRLHGDGRKEKLTAGGQFIVFFWTYAIAHNSDILSFSCCRTKC